MKNKRVIILGVLAVLGVAYVISIVPNFRHRAEWNQTVRALRSLPRDRVDSALEAFVRDQKAKGGAVPATVSFRDLVAGGFLRADEAAPFTGMEVTFGVGVDETRPQQILVRVPLSGGRVVVELADGSILQVAR